MFVIVLSRKIAPARVYAADVDGGFRRFWRRPYSLGKSQMADKTWFRHPNTSFSRPSPREDDASANLRRTAEALHLNVPPAPICEDLFAAVERAADRSTESMSQLRDAVAHFTAALRDEGAKPEAVLIALKSVINSRAFPSTMYYTSDISVELLRQQISSWSIEEFFREART